MMRTILGRPDGASAARAAVTAAMEVSTAIAVRMRDGIIEVTSGGAGSLGCSVLQVIKIDGLAVPVDPGGNQAEAVEGGAAGLVALLQVEVRGVAIERDGDPAAAAGAGGVVVEGPGARLGVGVDVRGF